MVSSARYDMIIRNTERYNVSSVKYDVAEHIRYDVGIVNHDSSVK